MPDFTLTLTFRGESGQKSYWEGVTEELQQKGARILDVQYKTAMVGEPLTPINQVTITYEAPKEIEIENKG